MKKRDSNGISADRKDTPAGPLYRLAKYLIGAVSFLAVALLVYGGRPTTQAALQIGEIAGQDIRAQIDFIHIDKSATDALIREASIKIPPIYYLNPAIENNTIHEIDELFSDITKDGDMADIRGKNKWLDSDIPIKTFIRASNPEDVKRNLIIICSEILDRGVITGSLKIKVISGGRDSVSLKNIDTGEVTEVNLDKFLMEDELDARIDRRLRGLHPFDRQLRQAMKDVILKQIRPNLVYDYDEVKTREAAAIKSIAPVQRTVKRGQIIIRRGDPVTEKHKIILDAHNEELLRVLGKTSHWWNILASAIVSAMLFFVLVTYLQYHQPEIFSCNKRLVLLGVIIVSTLVLSRVFSHILINPEKPFWQYFILVPAGAMLIAVLIDKELAIVSSMVMSALASLIAKQPLAYSIILFFGSIVGVQASSRLLHRWEFIRAGVFIGFAQVIGVLMVTLWRVNFLDVFPWGSMGYQMLGGFLGGIACAVFVSICLPPLEKIFNITTDIRLFELSDLNHPLLKKMVTEAPGTYHHSIVVSNMVEDVAENIGANSLLVKVGAYFHDIGKITKPEYFAENVWFEEKSRHEKLLPTMSNLVIMAHVKDGLQLARKYNLPQSVIDIISEHHGTTLVYYFYKQAEKAAARGARAAGEINEQDFRYPGPKPSTKESGIICLADSVEAAGNALVKPTPAKIEELVNEIIREKIADGQLDDCGLTFRDIHIIRNRFIHILTGILHKRVEYPEKNGVASAEAGGRNNVNEDKRK